MASSLLGGTGQARGKGARCLHRAMPVRMRGEEEAMLVGEESLGLKCRRYNTIKEGEGEGGWGCAENIDQLLKSPTLGRNSQSPTPHHAQNLSRTANENQPRLRPQNESCWC